MSEPRPADFIQLMDPEPGVFVLNFRVEGGEQQLVQLNREQVLNLNKDTADILVKAFK